MDCQFDDVLGRFCYKNQYNTIISAGRPELLFVDMLVPGRSPNGRLRIVYRDKHREKICGPALRPLPVVSNDHSRPGRRMRLRQAQGRRRRTRGVFAQRKRELVPDRLSINGIAGNSR